MPGKFQIWIMNDISKVPWNPDCRNFKIPCNILFSVLLPLGKMHALRWHLSDLVSPNQLSPLPQHSLFHTSHVVVLAAYHTLWCEVQAFVWNTLSMKQFFSELIWINAKILKRCIWIKNTCSQYYYLVYLTMYVNFPWKHQINNLRCMCEAEWSPYMLCLPCLSLSNGWST